jgi:molybdate transport system permease protein
VDWTPLYISGKLALITTLILMILGAPMAYFLTFSRFKGKFLCEALINLPLVLPPTVLGFYLLTIMGPKGFVGQTWEWIIQAPLVFSFAGIVIASVVYSFPFAVLPMKVTFTKIDRRLLESAFVLGLSQTATFFRVVLPNSVGGIVASAILVFVHTLGEFGVILMVGGSIPGRTKVASIAIYEAVEALRYNDAGRMSLTLLIICYTVLLVVNLLSEKK